MFRRFGAAGSNRYRNRRGYVVTGYWFSNGKKYNGINDLSRLKSLEEENKEGFVIKFKSGLLVKVKFSEYLRIHRIVTGISNITVWEHLSEGQSFESHLERAPDEFYMWVKNAKEELVSQFNNILDYGQRVYKQMDTRKETALHFRTQKYPAVLFAMLDGKSYDKTTWKMIRPQFTKTFQVDV